MQLLRYFAAAVTIVTLNACADGRAPTDMEGVDNLRPQSATHVSTISALKAALQNGRTWIVIDSPLYFQSSVERIVLDDHCLAHNCPPTVTIEGGANWDGAVFYRLANFPEPLLEAGSTRPWEVRLKGLYFVNWCPDFPTCSQVYEGPAFHLGSIRNSIIEDVRVQAFKSSYPVRVGHAGETRNVVFRDLALMWNQHPIRIDNASGVHWWGGHNQSAFVGSEAWAGWRSGLEIYGDATYGGPISIDDFHMEGGKLLVQGSGINFRGGYFFNTVPTDGGIYLNGTRIKAECNGVFVWDMSRIRDSAMLWINNVPKCFSEQGM